MHVRDYFFLDFPIIDRIGLTGHPGIFLKPILKSLPDKLCRVGQDASYLDGSAHANITHDVLAWAADGQMRVRSKEGKRGGSIRSTAETIGRSVDTTGQHLTRAWTLDLNEQGFVHCSSSFFFFLACFISILFVYSFGIVNFSAVTRHLTSNIYNLIFGGNARLDCVIIRHEL